MIGKVAQRREERVADIVAAAWDLARAHGIGGLSLHALAREVGIRQPSLYTYFDSKHALYDTMFADGNRQLLERVDTLEQSADPRAAVKLFMHAFVDFAVEDPTRHELLFHRPIPGFEPSPDSYVLAHKVLDRAVDVLHEAGLESDADVDCFTAMVAGICEAQISNDPGGDRWTRHLERLTDLHLDDARRRARR